MSAIIDLAKETLAYDNKIEKINYERPPEDTVGNLQCSDIEPNVLTFLDSQNGKNGSFYPLFQVSNIESSTSDDDNLLTHDNEIVSSPKRRRKVKKSRRRKASVSSLTSSSSLHKVNHSVNFTDDFQNLEQQIIQEISTKHSQIQTCLPFRTDIKGEIRTLSDNAVYSKQYPYPHSVNNFVNKEINRMLDENIIRPSKSPYNSPVWVVGKKGYNEDGSKKNRLVIDFKKLNENTVPDRYPMPDPSVILSNLGKARFFSTIDLESGFHQILMKDDDIEKTAFSINNGKYEFLRLPFGLANAPRIFQRAMDNILREKIGKTCHIYMDDIIVFSETAEQHLYDLKEIIDILFVANMKISIEKSKFFRKETEFLGYLVSHKIIKTDPQKIKTIVEYPPPRNIRELRGFLGLTGYYRKFVQNYASIAKPLTKLLHGHNGMVSKHMSKKIEITLDEESTSAFDNLKSHLTTQVELTQPDYSKKFVLTTDASDVAIGAVLSQDNKPITFISKTLNKTEQNYATNERELYAIVWALKNLRNYLYGVVNLEIVTDHQPLSFAVSARNPNSKMKRWHAFIEEYSPKILYKPGKTNVVADALSRLQMNNITYQNHISGSSSDSGTVHSAESSYEEIIAETNKPLNQFKQQLLISKNKFTIHEKVNNFDKTRHIIEYDTVDNLVTILKEFLQPNVVTGIYCTPEDLYEIQTKLKNTFTNKFLYTKKFLSDVINRDDQQIIIEETHARAHRGFDENLKQILRYYYWPKLYEKLKQHIRNCEVCNKNKYNRHPKQIPISKAPIPEREGEQLHIDIFYAQKLIFLTCIDAYSKYLIVKEIQNKSNMEFKILELIQPFPFAKSIMMDNEPSFSSAQFKSAIERAGLTIFYADPRHSLTNGQVERVHSTLIEIARCIQEEYNLLDHKEIIYRAVREYNNTIQSSTQNKPNDILFNKIDHTHLPNKLKTVQTKMLEYHNQKRTPKNYEVGDVIYEKKHGERNKLQPRYKKQTVKEDLENKVIINNKNRIIHKDNIKF